MRPVLFTGAPGAGKTTLLLALAAAGHTVESDSAREVIRERLAAGLPPRPQAADFAREVLRRDMRKYDTHGATAATEGVVFFDRGVPDALGLLHEAGALPEAELAPIVARYGYGGRAYLFPAWEAIFENDAERDQTFEQARAVHASIAEWYARCGYELVEVPPAPVEDRCAFILGRLKL